MPSYHPGYQPVRWPCVIIERMYQGIAMCAPVSPPVVVVLLKRRLGWSCESVTTMTAAIVTAVIAPGTHHHAARRREPRDGGGVSRAATAGSWTLTMPESGPSGARYRARSHADKRVLRSGVVRPHPGLRYRQAPPSWDRVMGKSAARRGGRDGRRPPRAPPRRRSVGLADATFTPRASGH